MIEQVKIMRATAARHHTRAQSIVEFALILPVFLIVLLGMFDLGRAFLFGVIVQNGAREAARVGSRAALMPSVSDQIILQRLIDASSPALAGCQPVTGPQPANGCSAWVFTITPTGSKSSGATLRVTAVGRPSIFTGFTTGAMGLSLPQITVQGQAVMELL